MKKVFKALSDAVKWVAAAVSSKSDSYNSGNNAIFINNHPQQQKLKHRLRALLSVQQPSTSTLWQKKIAVINAGGWGYPQHSTTHFNIHIHPTAHCNGLCLYIIYIRCRTNIGTVPVENKYKVRFYPNIEKFEQYGFVC